MNKGMKIGVACLLIGVLALGATIPFSTESYRTYNTSIEIDDSGEYSPYEDPSNNVLPYEQLGEDVRSIYVDTLQSEGTIMRELGEGVSNWPYDESKNLVIDRRDVDSLPPADENYPDSRYDAMAVETRSEDPPVSGDAVPFLLEAVGIGGIVLAVGIGFFRE